MIEVLVWLLIVSGRHSDVYTVERFPTVEACDHVRKNLPYVYSDNQSSRCIQARILVPSSGVR